MFRPALRQLRLARTFTTSRIVLAQAQAKRHTNPAASTEDAPIIQHVKRIIEERKRLQSEVRTVV